MNKLQIILRYILKIFLILLSTFFILLGILGITLCFLAVNMLTRIFCVIFTITMFFVCVTLLYFSLKKSRCQLIKKATIKLHQDEFEFSDVYKNIINNLNLLKKEV